MNTVLGAINFNIKGIGPFSFQFLDRGILGFKAASRYIHDLPYGRNADKTNLLTVFTDGCGTCSTKHALLKQLADENKVEGLELILCLFRMNAQNTPKVADTLQKYGLDYIPEAHNYLKYQGHILDFTGPGFDPAVYGPDILEETAISPGQITDFKVALHRTFLQKWLGEHPEIRYQLDELWTIREQCIRDLAG